MDNPSPDGSSPGSADSNEPPAAESPVTEPRVTETIPTPRAGLLLHAWAGLHAGIVGVFWMFGCFFIAAIWDRHGIWSMPNLFSTLFYGDNVSEGEFLRTTWSGIALIVAIYGLLGAVWGCYWKDGRKSLLSFYGALTGLVTYYLFFDFVWTHLNPLIPLYAPVAQLQVAHILWGAALARSPGYSRRLFMTMGAQEAAQIASGEVIR